MKYLQSTLTGKNKRAVIDITHCSNAAKGLVTLAAISIESLPDRVEQRLCRYPCSPSIYSGCSDGGYQTVSPK